VNWKQAAAKQDGNQSKITDSRPHGCTIFMIMCFALLCFALLCFALLCFALLCFALLCFALLCFALLCFALLCVTLLCSGLAVGQYGVVVLHPGSIYGENSTEMKRRKQATS